MIKKVTLTVCLAIGVIGVHKIVTAVPYGTLLCKKNHNYTCHTVKRGESWEKLFPNPTERDVAKRVNRMNTSLYPGLKIAMPVYNGTNPMAHAPFEQQIQPSGQKMVLVDLSDLAFGAYDETGNLEYWGPISGGQGYCSDINKGCHTPTGNFKIYRQQGANCVSTKFPVGKGGAPMPYCMFFNGGFALHGSPAVPGFHASHGCVRLFTTDAEWLNQNYGTKTRVIIRH